MPNEAATDCNRYNQHKQIAEMPWYTRQSAGCREQKKPDDAL